MATKVKATKRTSTRQWLSKASAAKNARREVLRYIYTSTEWENAPASYGADGYTLFIDRAPDMLPECHPGGAFNWYDPHTKVEFMPTPGYGPLRYPDVDCVTPRFAMGQSRIVVSVKALRDAVKLAAVFAKADYNRVLLTWWWCDTVAANLLRVSSNAVTGGASDVITCDNDPAAALWSHTGKVDVAVNYRYLLNALTGLGHIDGYVTIRLNNIDMPLRLDAGDYHKTAFNTVTDRTAVIMPMARRG